MAEAHPVCGELRAGRSRVRVHHSLAAVASEKAHLSAATCDVFFVRSFFSGILALNQALICKTVRNTRPGLLAFYRGVIPNYCKAVPAVGISFVTFEFVKDLLPA